VAESQKDSRLVHRLIAEEAPTFIVVCTVLYRALVEAVGDESIAAWYPAIVSKLKAEVQEGLHGFIRWLNAKTAKVRHSEGPQRRALLCGLSVSVWFADLSDLCACVVLF
jgi:hypothetical protein